MAYEVRALRRYKARENSDNSDNPLRVAVVRDGAKVLWTGTTGDTATATIYAPGGTTAIETATALTAVAGQSVLTLSIDTSADTTNYTSRTGYRADLSIEIAGQIYTGHVLFDVAPYLLQIPVTVDQLLARDRRLRGIDWAGDDDLSEIIEACRDEYQLRLEGVATESGRLLEDMALDANKVAVPFRLYVLAAIFRALPGEENEAAADHYDEAHDRVWGQLLAQIKPDTAQTGAEGSDLKQVQVRLHT